jgi:hypothetical protein
VTLLFIATWRGGEATPVTEYDAISFTLTGTPRITFDLKGGSRIRSFLSAEPRITFKLTAKPQ